MTGMPTNTTSNPRDRADEQPPLVPQGEPSSDQRYQIIKTGMSEISRGKLPERRNCTEPGHDLCRPAPDDDQHIPLSKNYVEVWVDELCQGENSYHDPPTVVKMSGGPINTTSNHRAGIEESLFETRPAHYFGFKLKNVAGKVLSNARKAGLMAKLTMYGRMVDFSSQGKTLNKFLRKSTTLPRWVVVIQDSINLLSPTYPLQIREQASRILRDFWLCYDKIQLTHNRDTMALKLIASLGRAFICCPGVQLRDTNTSGVITSLLYNSLIKSPLHTNLDEISSAFVLGVSRYLSDPDNHHPLLIDALADVIENVCHDDTWFLDKSGEVLHYVLRAIRMDVQTLAQSTNIAQTLFTNLEMLEDFLDHKLLFIVNDSQLNIRTVDVGKFTPGQMVVVVYSEHNKNDNQVHMRRKSRKSTIDVLSRVISNCKAIGRSTEDRYTRWRCLDIIMHACHLLHLIAMPFTGPSELSNSRCLSVVTQFGWGIVDVGELAH
ncbi:hypothetical protein BU17DRAFT_66252 [Hysterangium stoloniferum]|nr:hypothetical protein BU17DRAFT_66252 [Hysterangium stoloniferum]